MADLQALYNEHDHLESVLILRRARGMKDGAAWLWEVHDNLEREILDREAELPYEVVKVLRQLDPGVKH